MSLKFMGELNLAQFTILYSFVDAVDVVDFAVAIAVAVAVADDVANDFANDDVVTALKIFAAFGLLINLINFRHLY